MVTVELRIVVVDQAGNDRLELVADFDMVVLPGIDHQILIGGPDSLSLTVQSVQHVLSGQQEPDGQPIVVTCMTLEQYVREAQYLYRWGFVLDQDTEPVSSVERQGTEDA